MSLMIEWTDFSSSISYSYSSFAAAAVDGTMSDGDRLEIRLSMSGLLYYFPSLSLAINSIPM